MRVRAAPCEYNPLTVQRSGRGGVVHDVRQKKRPCGKISRISIDLPQLQRKPLDVCQADAARREMSHPWPTNKVHQRPTTVVTRHWRASAAFVKCCEAPAGLRCAAKVHMLAAALVAAAGRLAAAPTFGAEVAAAAPAWVAPRALRSSQCFSRRFAPATAAPHRALRPSRRPPHRRNRVGCRRRSCAS